MTFRLADHCGQYLSELACEDQRIYVLDGDLADSDGAIHFATKHPDRFVMAGIAEQCMVSVAAGMASCGLRPWVFSFGAFLCYRAYDQIRVCLSQSHQPVTLVGSHTGGLSARNGKTHAALNDIALMASLPGMNVWAPGDENDLKLAVRRILAGDKPAYLRLPRRPLDPLPGEAASCRWLTEPQPIALCGTGLGTHLALAAAQEYLPLYGLHVGVLHCPQVSPLPQLELAAALEQCEMIFVIEDHYRFGGLASLLQSLDPSAKIISLGWPNDWSGRSGNDEELLEMYGLAPHQLARSILTTVESSTSANRSKVLLS
ncbi:MAG TPA: transketolase C-terminal domain-containing protein [Pyrinomonadaceae bacterium]|jgi:transketolase|nr:transketolase C-terminal domain-containing protein [Pyrinomonadaceae bacterium]